MSPIGGGSHFQGPILGSDNSGGGLFKDIPMEYVSKAYSPWAIWYEDFHEHQLASAAGTIMATNGYTVSTVGGVAANTIGVNKVAGVASQVGPGSGKYLLINPGTTADTGYNVQVNAAIAAAATGAIAQTCGPIVSTATLMANRELLFATRIGYCQAAGRWAAGTGSKILCGWGVTDTGMMTAATGVPDNIATGGGLFFHISELGVLSFVTERATQNTPVLRTIKTLVDDASSTTVVGNWLELGFRAQWGATPTDATNNGSVEVFLNGRSVLSVSNELPMTDTETYSVTFEVLNGPAASPNIDVGVDYIMTGLRGPGRS